MNIQKTYGVNFGATRVLSVSKGSSVTDIYKLNANDFSFANKCLGVLKSRAGSSKKNMKEFFLSFLKNYQSRGMSDYYIGIKDDATITRGIKAISNHDFGRMSFGVGFWNDSNKLSRDSLVYSLLSAAQELSPENVIVNTYQCKALNPYCDDGFVHAEKIGDIKKQIEAKYPQHVFNIVNEDVNLDSIMGIDNFDDKILL